MQILRYQRDFYFIVRFVCLPNEMAFIYMSRPAFLLLLRAREQNFLHPPNVNGGHTDTMEIENESENDKVVNVSKDTEICGPN